MKKVWCRKIRFWGRYDDIKNCVKHAEIVNKASAAKASSSSLIRLFVIHCATQQPSCWKQNKLLTIFFKKISTRVLYLQEQQPETALGNKIKVRHCLPSGTRVLSLFMVRYDTVTKTSCQQFFFGGGALGSGELEGKKVLGRPSCRWKDRNQWWVAVNKIVNFLHTWVRAS